MKNIFKTLDKRWSTLFVFIILVFLLQIGPWVYSSFISLFAMLDQHTLFKVFSLVAILGLVFYVSIESKKHLHIPYAVSALIFGIAGLNL